MERLKQKDLRQYNPKLRAMVLLDNEMSNILNSPSLTSEEKMRIFNRAQTRFLSLFKSADAPARPEFEARQQFELDADELEDDEGEGEQAGIQPDLMQQEGPVSLTRTAPGSASALQGTDEFQDASALSPTLDRTSSSLPAKSWKGAIQVHWNRQPKLDSLLDLIEKNPHVMSQDSDSQLVYHGTPVTGSRFKDLVQEMFQHKKSHSTKGLEKFLSALHELKLDSSFISNSDMRSRYLGLFHPKKSQSTMSSSGEQHGFGHPPGKRPKILRFIDCNSTSIMISQVYRLAVYCVANKRLTNNNSQKE